MARLWEQCQDQWIRQITVGFRRVTAMGEDCLKPGLPERSGPVHGLFFS